MIPGGRRSLLVVLALLVALGAAGCGYSLRPSLPSHIRTIHIPVLLNRTQEPGIEDSITQALTEAFVTSGRVRIAESAARADAVLEGAIVGYNLTGIAFDQTANVTAYRLEIALALTLHDRVTDTVLWKYERLAERADFQVPGQVTVELVRENLALRQAAVEIGRTIVSLALEGF
jgi:hypothetical protein